MDSKLVICVRCGLRNHILKKELCNRRYCQGCGDKTDGKPDHESNLEKDYCSYCNRAVSSEEIKIHHDDCDMYPINCKYCNVKFVRCTMNTHEQECGRNLHWCMFAPIGCQFKGTRLEVDRHESDNVHMKLMMRLLLNLQAEQSSNGSMLARSFNELLSHKDAINSIQNKGDNAGVSCTAELNKDYTKMKSIQDHLEETIRCQELEINKSKQRIIELENKESELMERCLGLEQLVKNLDESKNLLKVEMDRLTNEHKQLEKSLNTFEDNHEKSKDRLTQQQTQQSDQTQEIENKFATLITANNQLAKTVADNEKMLNNKIIAVEKSHLESGKLLDELASNLSSFEYIWKVEKFANHQARAKLGNVTRISSDPFYPDKNGYKMRLHLYPNGDGEGKGTHLSIFLEVMKGENDAILKWPIEYCAKLSLLDQLKHKDHLTYQFKSDLIKNKTYFDRPLTVNNSGWGFAEFLSLCELQRLYLVDDTMFVKLDLTIKSLK